MNALRAEGNAPACYRDMGMSLGQTKDGGPGDVGPGYDALAATGDTHVKDRLFGATYDSMWSAALRAGADLVTITR